MSAPALIFISSWSSSVAPLMGGFAMTLLSWPLARKLQELSERNQEKDLPTPHQMSLIVGFLNGWRFRSTLRWVKLHVCCGKSRQKTTSLVALPVGMSIIALLLGILAFGADTCLHLTTESVNYITVTPTVSNTTQDGNIQSKLPLYSRILPEACTYYDNNTYKFGFSSPTGPCIISIATTNTFLWNSSVALQNLNNASLIHSFNLLNDNTSTYAFLAPANISQITSTEDFSATSFVLKTQCTPVSKKCNLVPFDGANTPYNCAFQSNGNFTGDLAESPWNSTFPSYNESVNPFTFLLAAQFGDGGNAALENDTQIITPVHGGVAFVLNCSTTTYNVEYKYSNGVALPISLTQANTSTADVFQQPMASTWFGVQWGQAVRSAAQAAIMSSTAQELADRLALSFSQIAVAMASGVMVPDPALRHQTRHIKLVTRVPKAPLYTLVGANMLLTLFGLILAIVAYVTWARGNNIRDVQSRLGVSGLVAQIFDNTGRDRKEPARFERGGYTELRPEQSEDSEVSPLSPESAENRARRVGVGQSPGGCGLVSR